MVLAPEAIPPLVRMRGIRKRFGPVEVLRDVRLDLWPGEVHVLAGENGAGKSTLIRILAGVYSDHEGTIELDGRPVRPRSPQEARALGVAVIHQELALVPALSVADNIYLGRQLTRGGFVDDRAQRAGARGLLERFNLAIDPGAAVETLPIALQQLVEIARALACEARVIIMDEPTSALSAAEVEQLFRLVADLRARGCAILYITHKMEEIERIADRITVLRDGGFVGSAAAAELPPARLIEWMVGRAIEEQFSRRAAHPGGERLRVENFSVRRGGRLAVDRVSLHVRQGEIVGIGGLQGSGASDLLLGLFGAFAEAAGGAVTLDGEPVRIRSPREAIARGIALLTSDRKATGLIPAMTVAENIMLAALPRIARFGWRRPAEESRRAEAAARRLRLRAASLAMEAGRLSGGNQQKAILARWLETGPRVLLLDEPTRGVDVGAKREIYELLHAWAAEGMAILLISTEMPELLALSDRIVVLHRGRVTAEFAGGDATPEQILEAAMGGGLHGGSDN